MKSWAGTIILTPEINGSFFDYSPDLWHASLQNKTVISGAQEAECIHLFGSESDNKLPHMTGHTSHITHMSLLSPGSAVQKACIMYKRPGITQKDSKRCSHNHVCVCVCVCACVRDSFQQINKHAGSRCPYLRVVKLTGLSRASNQRRTALISPSFSSRLEEREGQGQPAVRELQLRRILLVFPPHSLHLIVVAFRVCFSRTPHGFPM